MPELQERETTALSNSQMETAGNIELLPPQDVVLNSRAVMGAIDLDPWSCPNQNLLVQSARYYNRYQEDLDDICARPWTCRGEKRAFMIGKGAKETKRLLHKLLREYRQGTISEAVLARGAERNDAQLFRKLPRAAGRRVDDRNWQE